MNYESMPGFNAHREATGCGHRAGFGFLATQSLAAHIRTDFTGPYGALSSKFDLT